MKIALAQINPIIGDFDHNFYKISLFAEKAKDLLCDLVIFPELAVSGYPPRDLLEKKDFVRTNLDCLSKLVSTIRGIGVICGFADKHPNTDESLLYNAAVLFEDTHIYHRIYKRLLPTYDVFDERRYFMPGETSETVLYKGKRIGISICEDAWNDKDIFPKQYYQSNPISDLIQDGANILVNISASPFHGGKRDFRWNILRAISQKYKVPLIYVNQVGGNDSVLFDGVSTAFDSFGNMAARACDFDEDLVVFDLESSKGGFHPVSFSETEAMFKSLVMGTHDYVKKCGFSRVVLGLSGGIDSALTACIAVEALGNANVSGVFMPSRYTSEENYEDTRQLADMLGISLTVIPIDGMFKEFLAHISPDFDEKNPGVTEQNIQARIRGTILMGLSNKNNSLLLTTGNKSELAVGYCTLYGDMSGGLAVISDLPKTVVYELSEFINAQNQRIPQRIIDKAPSAELKPDQKDQDDLPPYPVLDKILKAYVEDLKTPDEIVEMGFEWALVRDVLSRVDRNEYKRHQAAPGLKVTSKAFGYGRRYPLAQRYYARLST